MIHYPKRITGTPECKALAADQRRLGRLGAMNEIVWALLAVAVVALSVTALVSISRAARGLTNVGSLLWALLVLFLPVIGSTWWFLSGRPAARRAASAKRR